MTARQVDSQERTAGYTGGPNMKRCPDMRARQPVVQARRAGSLRSPPLSKQRGRTKGTRWQVRQSVLLPQCRVNPASTRPASPPT